MWIYAVLYRHILFIYTFFPLCFSLKQNKRSSSYISWPLYIQLQYFVHFLVVSKHYKSRCSYPLFMTSILKFWILVQFSSVAQSCLTPCDFVDCNRPGLPVHPQLPEFTQTHLHWVGDVIQTSHPLLLLPSIFASIRVFSDESVPGIRWPKYWSFNFSISPSSEYSGLISFRVDWLDLLAVQGTLRVFSNTTVQKLQFSVLSFLYSPTLTSIHAYLEKP